MVSDLTTLIVAPTLADKFHHALQSPSQQMFETRVYICFPLIPGPKEPIKKMTIFLKLMEELKKLWQWVDLYDRHLKC
jgi:hypothetical protein